MEVVVTATGTEIGKTVVSAVLLARWAGRGGVTYWKPVATGAEEGSDSREVASLVGPEVRVLKECYRFAPPLSPHLAARMAGVEIEPERILSACRRHRESVGDGLLVVEGIGGLLVPLTDRGYLLADLLKALDLPCLVVSSSQLGTINHTLLTLEALRSRGLSLAGVVPQRSCQPGESAGHRAVSARPVSWRSWNLSIPSPGRPSRVRHPNSTGTGCWSAISWSPRPDAGVQ